MPQSFSFKPALLRRAITYSLTPDTLTRLDADGQMTDRIAWGDVTAAAMVEHGARGGLRLRRLDLIGTNGALFSVGCVSPGGEIDTPGSDGQTHLALIAEIATRLAIRDPDFEIRLGEYGRSRLAMFTIGILTLLAVIVFAVLVVATGLSTDRLAGAAVPGLLMLGLGAALAHHYAPWRPPVMLRAALLAEVLGARLPAGRE